MILQAQEDYETAPRRKLDKNARVFSGAMLRADVRHVSSATAQKDHGQVAGHEVDVRHVP